VRPLLRDAIRIFSARGARFLAAAVAFYALLAAAPLFVVMLGVLGAVLGSERAESAVWGSVGQWLAPDGVETVRTLTERLASSEASGGALGVVVLLYGSTRLFRALRRALNVLWGVDLEHVERGRPTAHKYGVRYGGALALVLFVIVLVALLALIKAAIALVPVTQLVFVLDGLVSIVLAFVLFAALFRFVPETQVTSRDAIASAAVTTVLFAIGSGLVTLWVDHRHAADLYDGAGALVVAILWVYYSAQVFFLGACVGAALHARRSSLHGP
jgi:membrane protein